MLCEAHHIRSFMARAQKFVRARVSRGLVSNVTDQLWAMWHAYDKTQDPRLLMPDLLGITKGERQ